MRVFYVVPVIGVLAACSPAIPDSGAGVGFNTPEYQAQREATLQGQTVNGDPLVPPSAVSSEALNPATAPGAPLSATGTQVASLDTAAVPQPGTAAATSVPQTGGSAQDIANETAAALSAANQNSGVAPLQASPSNPQPVLVNNTGISDEQDFQAVSNRQSIESDAARIEKNRTNYQVVAPTAVPQRDGAASPNVVQYALNTDHPKGTKLYSRAGFNLQAKAQRNCAAFASADQAQIEFLSAGGPRRDRKGLDPDGDGYACGWDPARFRKAVTN